MRCGSIGYVEIQQAFIFILSPEAIEVVDPAQVAVRELQHRGVRGDVDQVGGPLLAAALALLLGGYGWIDRCMGKGSDRFV